VARFFLKTLFFTLAPAQLRHNSQQYPSETGIQHKGIAQTATGNLGSKDLWFGKGGREDLWFQGPGPSFLFCCRCSTFVFWDGLLEVWILELMMLDDTPTFDALASAQSTGLVFLVFLVFVLGIWFEVTGLADLIFPRSGSLNGPEVFWFHPVELGKEGFLLLITALKVIPKRFINRSLFHCRTLSSMFLFRFAYARKPLCITNVYARRKGGPLHTHIPR
jgi:hypothetical protein